MSGPAGIVLNSGAGGATLGVDSDGTYDYQILKIGYSVAGSTPTQVSATNPLPVVQTGALPAGANLIGAVNVSQLNGNAPKLGSGTGSATGSLNVYVATDQPSLTNAQPVAQSGAWTVSVNGVVADATAFTRGTTSELPVAGLAETAAPTLTTGHAAALSLNLSGGLRVDGSGVTQPVSGTITANQGGAPWSDNVSQFGGSAVVTGTGAGGAGIPRVTVSSDSSLAANQSVNVNQIAGSAPKTGSGNGSSTGSLNVYLATDQPSLSNALPVSQSGSWSVGLSAGTAAIGSVNLSPVAGQGWPSTYSGSIGATVTAVKTAAGTLGGWYVYNADTVVEYVQFFDAAVASVTLGTTAPKLSIGIPPGGAANLEFANGLKFSTAITIAVTTTRAGSSAPAATVDINLWYA